MKREFSIQDSAYTKEELLAWCAHSMDSTPQWEQEIKWLILEWFNQETYIISHTSGSTGEPKEIRIPKKQMEASAKLTASFFDLPENADVLLALPVRYIAGKMVVIRALVNGWHLHWTEPASNPLEHLQRHFHFASFTPMQVDEMIQRSPNEFSKIDKVLIGGAPISNALEEKLQFFKNAIYATYGMTETITHVAVRRLSDATQSFLALPGVRFSKNENGCLVIDAEHLDHQLVITNDLVELFDHNRFNYLGRADNVINSGGVKLFPEKLEDVLSRFMPCEFFYWKKSDERLGEKLVLYIEDKKWEDEKWNALNTFIHLHFSSFEKPAEINFVEKFERTTSQKIKRKNYDQ